MSVSADSHSPSESLHSRTEDHDSQTEYRRSLSIQSDCSSTDSFSSSADSLVWAWQIVKTRVLSQSSPLTESNSSSQGTPRHPFPSGRTFSVGRLLSSASTPSPGPISHRQPCPWLSLTIDASLANMFAANTPTISPIHSGNAHLHQPQKYYPGISIPSIPPPSSSPSTLQQGTAKLWIPLGESARPLPPWQSKPSMWLPPSSPLYVNGIQTTYPGMALAATAGSPSQDSSVAYLSGPWYTLAAHGPNAFLLTLERERVLTYVSANVPIPAEHLWAVIAELYLCKRHYTRRFDDSHGSSSWSSMECAFDLSPYFKVAYDIDILEGNLDAMYERLERFTNRGSPMWGLKVGSEDKTIWEAMAKEAEEGFNRLAVDAKQHVFDEWKRYCWDAAKNIVKRAGAK